MIINSSTERYESASLTKSKQTQAVKQIKAHFTKEKFDTGDIGKCLVLVGSPGTGKTYGLYALLNAASGYPNILGRLYDKWNRKDSNDCSCSGYSNFIGMIDTMWFREYLNAEFADKRPMLEKVQSLSILLIDDLGMEPATDTNMALIEAILDYRYQRAKTTVITSNLPLDRFKERYSERIIDRLREWGIFFECTDPSFRAEPGSLEQIEEQAEEGEFEQMERLIEEQRKYRAMLSRLTSAFLEKFRDYNHSWDEKNTLQSDIDKHCQEQSLTEGQFLEALGCYELKSDEFPSVSAMLDGPRSIIDGYDRRREKQRQELDTMIAKARERNAARIEAAAK